MFNKFKRMKTRKKMLLIVCLFVILFTIISIIFQFVSLAIGSPSAIDSTLVSEVFSFGKWVVTTGCVITVAKTVKSTDESGGE